MKKTQTPTTPDWVRYEAMMGLRDDKPEDAIVVTYSELDTFRQCPLKHKWSYRDKYRKNPGVGSALTRGSLWHAVMESHYLLIRHLPARQVTTERLMDFALQNFLVDQVGGQDEDQERVEWMYQGYLEYYGLDDEWEPVVIEQAGEVPLNEDESIWLRFKVDLVVKSKKNGTLWLLDHKTTAMFGKQSEIDLDEQFRLYTWALRKLGIPIHGIIRSDARSKRNKGPMALDNRFKRVTSFCSELEGQNVADDALRAAQAAYLSDAPIYASPAPDRCTWRCDYLQVHLGVRRGLGTEEQMLRDFGFTQSDEKHREYAEDPIATRIRSGEIEFPVPTVRG